jgi:hypothetical protein
MKLPDWSIFWCCSPPDSRLWCFLDQLNHIVLGRFCVDWVCNRHDKQITKLAEQWDKEN